MSLHLASCPEEFAILALEPFPDVSILRLVLRATAMGPFVIFGLLCNADSKTGLGKLTTSNDNRSSYRMGYQKVSCNRYLP